MQCVSVCKCVQCALAATAPASALSEQRELGPPNPTLRWFPNNLLFSSLAAAKKRWHLIGNLLGLRDCTVQWSALEPHILLTSVSSKKFIHTWITEEENRILILGWCWWGWYRRVTMMPEVWMRINKVAIAGSPTSDNTPLRANISHLLIVPTNQLHSTAVKSTREQNHDVTKCTKLAHTTPHRCTITLQHFPLADSPPVTRRHMGGLFALSNHNLWFLHFLPFSSQYVWPQFWFLTTKMSFETDVAA